MDARQAIDRLCRDLGVPPGDAYIQDWAFEMPADYRSEAWFNRYLEAFQRADYGWWEREELLDLIFDIVEQALREDRGAGQLFWHRALTATGPYLMDHRERIEYWACLDYAIEELGNAFALTPFVRQLLGDLDADNAH
jgi:hypothetical protein